MSSEVLIPTLQLQIAALARDAGFSDAGIAPVSAVGSGEGREESRRFKEWIDQGRAAEMEYLKRRNEAGELVRSSLQVALPWVRSVVVCVANYNAVLRKSTDNAPEDAAWIARYAWSGQGEADRLAPADYHKVLLKRLQQLEQRLQQELGPFESRCYVDTGPLVERVYARYAGIGWVGKNTCILNQQLGSWLFLGVVLTSLDIPEDGFARLAADRCGSCTRCLDACPTGALVAPYQMDAGRCISYLTIEKRGEIPEELRAGIGRQVFGCDICQDVCPWNRKAPITADPELQARPELVNPALDWLAGFDRDQFGRMFFGSPVKRAKYEGFRRNVAIAMGNSGLIKFLPRLEEWSHTEDAVLADAARWAIRRIREIAEREKSPPSP